MTKEGIKKHVLSKIALAFLLIISMMAPFITAPSASAATSLTVAEALAQYDVAAKKNVTVDGYIVGYVKGETSVVKTGATDDNNYAIADSANETDLSKMIYVQVPATPTTLRSTFGLKTNPGNIGKKVSVSASLEKYFGNHAGLKAPVSAMTFVGGEVDPPPVAEAVANIAAARAVTDPAKLIKVSGTVTTGVGFWGQKGFYIQDDTAGLYAFVSAADVKPGDIVELEGKVSPYAGELQIQPTKITVKSSGNPLPAAQVIVPTGVNEDTQGERIQLNKVTITGLAKKDDYGTFEFSAVDGQGKSVIVRNDNRTGMTYDNFIQYYNEGDLVHVSGIASKFNDVYQVKALGAESFDLVNKPAVYVNVFPGFVTENTKITLASGWADATIYYTVNGSTPTTSSDVYSAPINVTENTTIKALAVSGDETSEVFSFEYQVIKSTGVQIADIQGKQHKSPYADQQVVDIEGVVTYKLDNNNFFMQDLTPDSDPATSDAVLVYSKAHTFVPGDLVSVDGKVTEFFIAGYSDMKSVDLSTTEISSTTIDKIGTKPVPAALKWEELSPPTEVIDNDKLTSFDPAEDGIDFWESIEGMLVSVKDAKVVGPQKYGEVIVATDNGGKTTFNKFGGINISANDYNPERITVDMNSVSFKAKSGDVFKGTITGPVSYEFGNFRIMTTVAALPTLEEAPIIKEITEIAFAKDKLNVAAYNVENFSNNTANTPNEKVVKIAKSFVENMKSPDIITLVEVQDNDGETASGNTDASQSYERLIAAIVAAGGPKYNWTDIAPEYNQDGGAPGGNIRVGYLYNPQRVTLSEGTKGGSTEAVKWVDGELSKNPGRILDIPQPNTRKPIAAQFEFQGEQVVVIGAHLNSKGGDQPLFGKNQPPFLGSEAERIGLATMINAFIKKGQEQNPDLKVIVAGDMNDFEFTPTLTALKGNILTNMVEKVPAGERFSYYYQGNNQVLDHMLVTNNLAATTLIDMIHINANFMEEHGRASDHDPILVQVDLKDPVVVPDVVTLDVNKDDVSVEVGDT
ncbi:hypothetical protein HMPREF1210_01715, partial [Paenisporosarcina sp. HGH0030]|uniref:DUF6359 domain-containing protein n=1 Tax=Paenisporosarcina sp. HGH0030 TaxID=1078085 RepID=UPI00034EB02D